MSRSNAPKPVLHTGWNDLNQKLSAKGGFRRDELITIGAGPQLGLGPRTSVLASAVAAVCAKVQPMLPINLEG